MDVLIYLIPAALLLGGLGLVAFLWSLRSGQFDDLDGAAQRILFDDEGRAGASVPPAPPGPGRRASWRARSVGK
jgi:cbb3-type cytochrome oxidase maturation protein